MEEIHDKNDSIRFRYRDLYATLNYINYFYFYLSIRIDNQVVFSYYFPQILVFLCFRAEAVLDFRYTYNCVSVQLYNTLLSVSIPF